LMTTKKIKGATQDYQAMKPQITKLL